jgi:hypothetical protein
MTLTATNHPKVSLDATENMGAMTIADNDSTIISITALANGSEDGDALGFRVSSSKISKTAIVLGVELGRYSHPRC